MANPSIACCNSDILKLHVHVVFRCFQTLALCALTEGVGDLRRRTFNELATVDLSGGDLKSNNVALVKKSAELYYVCLQLGEDGEGCVLAPRSRA